MKELDISRRSAFRLLQTLEELGFPLTDEQSRPKSEKTYLLTEGYILKLPNIVIPNPYLNKKEIIYILSLLKVCKQSKMLAETSTHKSAMAKLSAMLEAGKRDKYYEQ